MVSDYVAEPQAPGERPTHSEHVTAPYVCNSCYSVLVCLMGVLAKVSFDDLLAELKCGRHDEQV